MRRKCFKDKLSFLYFLSMAIRASLNNSMWPFLKSFNQPHHFYDKYVPVFIKPSMIRLFYISPALYLVMIFLMFCALILFNCPTPMLPCPAISMPPPTHTHLYTQPTPILPCGWVHVSLPSQRFPWQTRPMCSPSLLLPYSTLFVLKQYTQLYLCPFSL